MSGYNDSSKKMSEYLGGMAQGNRAFIMQPYTESNCKSGKQFTARYSKMVGNTGAGGLGHNVYHGVSLKTPADTPVILKTADIITGFNGGHGYVQATLAEGYEPMDGTTSTGYSTGFHRGVETTDVANTHDSSFKLAVTSFTSQTGRTYQNLTERSIPAYSGGMETKMIPEGQEYILKKDTWYSFFVYTHLSSNASVGFTLSWYEGEIDLYPVE